MFNRISSRKKMLDLVIRWAEIIAFTLHQRIVGVIIELYCIYVYAFYLTSKT